MLVHGPLQAEQELDDLQEPSKLGDYAMRLPSTQRDLRSLAALMSRWYRKWTADSLKVCSGQERHFRNGIFRTPIDELFAAGQPSDHQAGIACLEFCDMDKLAGRAAVRQNCLSGNLHEPSVTMLGCAGYAQRRVIGHGGHTNRTGSAQTGGGCQCRRHRSGSLLDRFNGLRSRDIDLGERKRRTGGPTIEDLERVAIVRGADWQPGKLLRPIHHQAGPRETIKGLRSSKATADAAMRIDAANPNTNIGKAREINLIPVSLPAARRQRCSWRARHSLTVGHRQERQDIIPPVPP